ncbi:hypothetical protein ACH5RR_039223 [Cinchona calisaya]|uniref:Uncharacterized protein n=1 Tax=Cinchona calisaya TaxID=153742 RepID=A0ABD2Y1Q1_9GENT
MPPGFVLNAPVSEEKRNELQGYWMYSQLVIHNNLTLIGEALKTTSLGIWVWPPPPPVWHFGLPCGQHYIPPTASVHQEGSSQAGVTGGDQDDDHEEAQPSNVEEVERR